MIEVRAATEGDVDAMLRLEQATGTAPHWAAGVYREMVRGGTVPRGVYVAVREGELVGFAVGSMVNDEGEIESIAVSEAVRRQGVGRVLLDAVMGWCRAMGAEAIGLEVREGGAAARGLYEAVGFHVVGRRRGYYVDPVEDAVVMRVLWQGSDGPV